VARSQGTNLNKNSKKKEETDDDGFTWLLAEMNADASGLGGTNRPAVAELVPRAERLNRCKQAVVATFFKCGVSTGTCIRCAHGTAAFFT
jgi:hypothetical protein